MTSTDLGSAEWERSKISNQDINMLKRMGFSKKENALQFPKEESYPKPPINYRLHHLTPNSLLHISIFITLCWRKKWLYIHEESSNPAEENIAPFDGEAKIFRRRSWDAEATEAEKLATEALMTRIHELQNTRGKELSGIEITAYFLRTRVQPLQARKNPFWKYTGEEDADRLSKDLPLKDFEKLIRKISSLNKKDLIPTSCRVAPFSSTNPLPEGHPVLSSLPPLPEGDLAESNKRADALAVKLKQSEENRQKAEQDAATVQDLRERLHKAETALSDNITQQSAREAEILSRLESQCRRFVRRTHQEYEVDGPVGDELLDALTLSEIHGDEARDGLENAEAGLLKLFPYFFPKKETPATFVELAKTFNGPEDLGLKLRQEGLKIGVEGTIALTANSQQDVDWSKLIFDNYTSIPDSSEVFPSSLPKKFSVPINFVDDSANKGLAEELKELRGQLQSVKKQSLAMMEKTRKASEQEELALRQAKEAVAAKDVAVLEAKGAATRENSMLELMMEASTDMLGSVLDAAAEDQRVNERTNLLVNLSLNHGSLFWATPERTQQIVRFQDRACQVRDYLVFCTKTLSMVYNSMFPRNIQPKTLPELMEKFKDAHRIHNFVELNWWLAHLPLSCFDLPQA
ncbi:hypothetical protein QYE76_063796 [Lolium multiflorum]|uniref:Uncharacterized protein n=1 Tax=Lolium multiflorum TaxID=4521 RepID=A0AAD8W6Z0_LOLMU|nr:hypothetical protein QYE76_063796 [Lolium multiflorum]